MRLACAAGVHPPVVESLELVLEPDAVRRHEAGRGEGDGDFSAAWPRLARTSEELVLVHAKASTMTWGGVIEVGNCVGSTTASPLVVRHPDASVRPSRQRRLRRVVRVVAAHPLVEAEDPFVDDAPVGEQVDLSNHGHADVRGNPQCARPVVQDLEHPVVGQAVRRAVATDFPPAT